MTLVGVYLTKAWSAVVVLTFALVNHLDQRQSVGQSLALALPRDSEDKKRDTDVVIQVILVIQVVQVIQVIQVNQDSRLFLLILFNLTNLYEYVLYDEHK